jgi:hemerythrin-like domain-containing protein
MKLTDRLKAEHGIFLKQLAFLESLANMGAPPSVLGMVTEAIVTAEEDHSQIEGRVLYPELEKAVGKDYAPLKQVAQEHAILAALVARMRAGTVDAAVVKEFVKVLRDHIEWEIHGLFGLAEEWIPAERLEALVNWDEEHLYESMGKRKEWVERWLKEGAR